MPQVESPLAFPKLKDKARLDRYIKYDRLFESEHYDAFLIAGDQDFNDKYNKLRYVVANFAGLLSKVMADVLFGEKVGLQLQSDANQKFVDALAEQNELWVQMYESAINNSSRGDSLFKVRVGQRNINDLSADPEIIIEEIDPGIYFPVFDKANARFVPSEDVLAWTFEQGDNIYLQKEIHRPGYIANEVYLYDPKSKKIISQEDVTNFGLEPLVETGINRSLIVHIPNVRGKKGFWGTSDYQDIEQLQFALNNRITKTDNILDKHSDPILAVPPGVLDDDGKIKKEALGMFEVDNENAGFNKPEYIVWNANLDAAFTEIDKLVELLFMFSEVSPAGSAMDKDGKVESGRALKFKLMATLRKRDRKIRYYTAGLVAIVQIALELALKHGIRIDGLMADKVERPTIKWGDGVINDQVEMTEIATQRIDNGTMSKTDAIMYLDDIDITEAKKKAKEIEKEGQSDNPILNAGSQFATDKPIPTQDGGQRQPVPPQGVTNGRPGRS